MKKFITIVSLVAVHFAVVVVVSVAVGVYLSLSPLDVHEAKNFGKWNLFEGGASSPPKMIVIDEEVRQAAKSIANEAFKMGIELGYVCGRNGGTNADTDRLFDLYKENKIDEIADWAEQQVEIVRERNRR